MLKSYMNTWLRGWLTKVNQLLKNTSGLANYVMFVDNPTGRFSFVKGAAIQGINVATSPTELTQAKAAVENLLGAVGLIVANQVDRTIEFYDQASGTWSSNAAVYSDHIKPSRFYYSPYNRFVWYTTSFGELRRLKTTTFTQIG